MLVSWDGDDDEEDSVGAKGKVNKIQATISSFFPRSKLKFIMLAVVECILYFIIIFKNDTELSSHVLLNLRK